MHGVLVLPALAWVLAFAQRPERFRLAAVRTATAGYLLLAVVVVAEALGGIDPLALSAAPVAATAVGGIGVFLLLAAIMVTLLAVAGHRRLSAVASRRRGTSRAPSKYRERVRPPFGDTL